MSALAAVVYHDPSAWEESAAMRMIQTMAARAPDGLRDWARRPVALAHGALHTTPESSAEHLPLQARDGALAVTAVTRLDNRQELLRDLHLESGAGDGRLLLAGYERWGEHLPEHLLGDFSFAIWDEAGQRLFCACDRFAVKPLYWYRSDPVAAVATEIKALLALDEIPRGLNETRLADVLCFQFEDAVSTVFRDVQRLAPGHALSLDARGAKLRRYWALDPDVAWTGGSDSEYEEAFRSTFTEAVRTRLRAPEPMSAMLSGGLDSSSVVVMARDLRRRSGCPHPLHTISARFRDAGPRADEHEFIRAVLALGDLEPHFVHPERWAPLEDWEGAAWRGDEPELHSVSLSRALYGGAAELGARCILDGLAGDVVVSHGAERLTELAARGRWITLVREARALGAADMADTRSLLRGFAVSPFVPSLVRRVWRSARERRSRLPHWTRGMPINRELAVRLRLAERYEALNDRSGRLRRSPRHIHHAEIASGLVPVATSIVDRLAALFAVEPRYPFLDSRLAELCLAIPSRQKLRGGYSRDLARRALNDLLPPEIRYRTGKGTPGTSPGHSLPTTARSLLDSLILESPGAIERYVDLAQVQDIYRRCRSQPGAAEWTLINRVAVTALWLDHARARFGLTV